MLEDAAEDTVHVMLHVMVGNAQDGQATANKDLVTLVVRNLPVFMHGPVHFNDQSGGMTIEVCDETTDDLLTPKVQAFESIGLEALPEQLLAVREAAPEVSRLFKLVGRNSLAGNDIFVGH